MGIAINNTKDLLNLTGNIFKDPAPVIAPGKELLYVREVQRQTDKFGDAIPLAANKGKNLTSLYQNLHLLNPALHWEVHFQ